MPGGAAWELPETGRRAPGSASREQAPRLPGWSALSSGESPQRGGPGSYSSSWAWRGASAQCLLRVEPDTLWNGPRLVGHAPGAAAAPAMKLHSRGAWGVRPPRSREGGHKEGGAETRDVIRQHLASRARGWAASQENRRGEARGVGMEQAGQRFTVLTIGVPAEEATSEQT